MKTGLEKEQDWRKQASEAINKLKSMGYSYEDGEWKTDSIPLKMDGKVIGTSRIYDDGMAHSTITDRNAADLIRDKILIPPKVFTCDLSVPKECDKCGAKYSDKGPRIMMESIPSPAVVREGGEYICKSCGARQQIHLVGPNNDFSQGGTHPVYGNGSCGNVGELTDCISSITCHECRAICRTEGMSGEWMENEWKMNDEYRENN